MRRRPWRFNAHWIRKEQCEEVIKQGWESRLEPDCFERLFRGIAECQAGLRRWLGAIQNNPRKHIDLLKEQLHDNYLGPQTEQTRVAGAAVRGELEKVYTDEDIYWRQRSKISWAKDGDHNTSFFHQAASARKSTNTIDGLFNSEGVWCEEDEDLETIITEYFGGLFETSSPDIAMIDETMEAVRTRIAPEMMAQLTAPFTSAEVLHSLSLMAPLKSPGPDGLPVIFFQKYWHVIGSDIISCVLGFLNLRRLPSALNYTFIVLIPKVSKPKHMTEFRLISLGNVIYKLGSKTIANRIKPVLDSIISDTQYAFVPGRLISDNVLVAYEVNHFIRCHSQGKRAYMALKLDVSKAYDRIEWVFLRKVLLRLGFPDSLVNLIMLCVSSVSYSFVLNGSQFGFLTPNRGIRQGDPLSPYLFISGAGCGARLVKRHSDCSTGPNYI